MLHSVSLISGRYACYAPQWDASASFTETTVAGDGTDTFKFFRSDKPFSVMTDDGNYVSVAAKPFGEPVKTGLHAITGNATQLGRIRPDKSGHYHKIHHNMLSDTMTILSDKHIQTD